MASSTSAMTAQAPFFEGAANAPMRVPGDPLAIPETDRAKIRLAKEEIRANAIPFPAEPV